MAELNSRSRRYITGPGGKQARPRIVVFDSLSVRHQEQLVLDDISLSVYEGEAVAILGSPGAGKSMLLACLQGLVQPVQGHIYIFGAELPPVTPIIRRQVGIMPGDHDKSGPYISTDKETVADCVKRFAAFYDIQLSQVQIDEYIHHYAAGQSSLHSFSATLPVAQLTPLQCRVLSLALAVVHDPKLVLLDEPLARLSATDSIILWHYLKQMQSEGRTLLITFAPPITEEQLSGYDVIVRLANGRIVHEGTRKGNG